MRQLLALVLASGATTATIAIILSWKRPPGGSDRTADRRRALNALAGMQDAARAGPPHLSPTGHEPIDPDCAYVRLLGADHLGPSVAPTCFAPRRRRARRHSRSPDERPVIRLELPLDG